MKQPLVVGGEYVTKTTKHRDRKASCLKQVLKSQAGVGRGRKGTLVQLTAPGQASVSVLSGHLRALGGGCLSLEGAYCANANVAGSH